MLNLKKLLAGIGLLFLASLVGAPAASFFFTAPIKIGGDLYQHIAHENDILAATLPPDTYLIETHYMVAHTMIKVYKDLGSTTITDYKEVKRLIADAPRIQQDYQRAYDRFMSSPLTEPDLLQDLQTSHQHVQRYFELLNKQFLPILDSGDTVAIKAQFDLMVESFEIHRGVIEGLLPKIRAHIDDNERQAAVIQQQVIWSIGVLSVGLLTLGLIIVYTAYKVSIKPLMRVARDIHEGTEQSRMASSQLTEASQKLAQGASEQAAAIEETSAALEEVSSMIHSTAQNAEQAKQLASETRGSAQDGVRNMLEMTTAMEAIERSSSDVAKIVKSIDEIAFQTNILALNAAVEAARAGEAGAGFAVVADEVRSLAQRSATAAHESAEKIEASIRNSRLGAVSLERVKDSLGLIETKIGKTDALVAEITLAAREQAQGIEHVSIAIEQMNKVAQDAAESASQIAHAAEQTHDQAKRVEDWVEQGIQVVGFKVQRRDRSVSQPSSGAVGRATAMTDRGARADNGPQSKNRSHVYNSLSHDGKPKLNGPNHQADQHFKDF
jgi:methyl-accepting chemotaxis protein